MPRGDKSKYTEKQKRQAKYIEEGYKRRGATPRWPARHAWATVNKAHGGGEKPGGSGFGKRIEFDGAIYHVSSIKIDGSNRSNCFRRPNRSNAFLRLCFAALRTGAPVKA
jgi:hypothetical protein